MFQFKDCSIAKVVCPKTPGRISNFAFVSSLGTTYNVGQPFEETDATFE